MSLPPSPPLSLRLASPWIWLLPLFCLIGAGGVLLAGGNESVFLAINHTSSPWAPDFWAALGVCWSFMGSIALFAPSLIWRPRWMASMMLALPAIVLGIHGGKVFFAHPRPLPILGENTFFLIGQQPISSSFPSGHTAAACCWIATIIFCAVPQHRARLACLLLPLVVLAAWARIAVGVHWPYDILAGAALGWLLAVLGTHLSARWEQRWNNIHVLRLMALFAAGCGLAVWFWNLGYSNEVPVFQRALAIWGFLGGMIALIRTFSSGERP